MDAATKKNNGKAAAKAAKSQTLPAHLYYTDSVQDRILTGQTTKAKEKELQTKKQLREFDRVFKQK